ncbi:MAG: hypothetical protein DWQ31_17800 [Planctomycetota bacterium]|nr:MAG: hypothetical protein DWQ31_17800 [Planctomycetota bacterium]REJ94385.1 MAG: hypothetical protein DWQ35_08280 [Planctomycetota bacterium]REK22082.1 MAG: hypothetical protein DWQ42_18245 [Planctomycetota bacterium]REK44490.1 MAG: hypothetical protein DWQ46_09530 [Planctomycetota bacterium]
MGDFKFRLATLQKLREGIRDERRAALAEAYHAEQLLEGRLTEIEAERAELRRRQTAMTGSSDFDPDQLLEIQRYDAVLTTETNALARQGKLLEMEIARRTEAVVKADRDVRVLENLESRQKQRHELEQERQLQRELDEFAALSHVRKEREPCHGS